MTHNHLNFQASCKTTAMGIMPHTNVEKALELVLSLDIPFWPQLPNISFYEDMYVQTSQNFPGIAVDPSIIPLGSILLIEGVGIREADDVGGAIKGRKIDVRMRTHREALIFGRKELYVWRRR